MGLRSRIPALNEYKNKMMEEQGMDSMRSPAAINWQDLQKQQDLKDSSEYYSKLSKDPGSVGVEEIKTETPGTEVDYKEAGLGAAKTAASGGSGEDVLAAGLMSSGNPYAIGAGLGLMALSSINKQKQAQKNREYEAKVAQINARRAAVENLARIGQSLRA